LPCSDGIVGRLVFNHEIRIPELTNERMRQEAELHKVLGAYMAKIGNATNSAVTPAADKLLSVALDAIRERNSALKISPQRINDLRAF